MEDPCNLLTFEQNVFTTLSQILLWIPLIILWENKKKKISKLSKESHKMTIMDHILGGMMVFFMILNTFTRFGRGVPHWLVQPCHILTLMLIYIIYDKKNNPDVFTFVLYCNWMPVLGLLFYDPNWYYYFYELPLFHLQHVLMVIVPWYYVWNGRFQTHFNPNRIFIYGQAVGLAMLYHAIILVWISQIYNEDFSGMKCRFPGGEFAGRYWREVQVVLGAILAILFGIIPEIIILKIFYFNRTKTE